MFLCKPCHAKSGCKYPQALELTSRGPCENCHDNTVCTDCHGYDFRRAADNSDAEDES